MLVAQVFILMTMLICTALEINFVCVPGMFQHMNMFAYLADMLLAQVHIYA